MDDEDDVQNGSDLDIDGDGTCNKNDSFDSDDDNQFDLDPDNTLNSDDLGEDQFEEDSLEDENDDFLEDDDDLLNDDSETYSPTEEYNKRLKQKGNDLSPNQEKLYLDLSTKKERKKTRFGTRAISKKINFYQGNDESDDDDDVEFDDSDSY